MKQGRRKSMDKQLAGVSDDNLRFQTSSFSASSNCVAVAMCGDGSVVVRDSKNRTMQMFIFSKDEWTTFICGVKHGEFDAESQVLRAKG